MLDHDSLRLHYRAVHYSQEAALLLGSLIPAATRPSSLPHQIFLDIWLPIAHNDCGCPYSAFWERPCD